MKKLYFVRHGLSEMNKAGLRAGRDSDTPLAREGRLQAEKAGLKAKKLGIDHIVSSPQIRAHDTARIIATIIGFPVDKIELNSLFVERGYGVLEGQKWEPDLDLDGFADVETTDTLLHRTNLGYAFLQSLPYDTILVVSHGSTGRALRHTIHPDIPFQGGHFPNAEIFQLL